VQNNRQWAVLFWLAALLGLFLSRPDLRSQLRDIAKLALSPALVVPFAAMAAWVSGLVYLAVGLGLWDRKLAADTAFWFLFAGLVLFGKFDDARKEEHFFRRKALSVLRIGVVVEVYSEFFVLNLIAETLLVQPFFAVVGGLSVVAGLRREHQSVKALVDGLMVAASLGILAYVAVSLVHNWGATDMGGLLRQLALPVWLTVGTLPFVYALGLLEAYRSTFRRIDWRSQTSRRARARSKLALLATFHVRARELGKVSAPLEFRLASTGSFRDARRVIRELRR
jgi:hypothetical protein